MPWVYEPSWPPASFLPISQLSTWFDDPVPTVGLLCLIPWAWILPASTPKQLQLSALDILCLYWKSRVDDVKELYLRSLSSSIYFPLIWPLAVREDPPSPRSPSTCFILTVVSSASSGASLLVKYHCEQKTLTCSWDLNYDDSCEIIPFYKWGNKSWKVK